jgi:glycerol-3-phosphate acyltransferase PlsY
MVVTIFSLALLILLSYLMGSIPFSLVVGKLFFKKDIRNYGSGNLGGTNTGRVLGKGAGLAVMILDQLKAVLAILITTLVMKRIDPNFLNVGIYMSSIAVVLGHCYPIFAKFKGGKAVACAFGILFITNIYIYLITLAIYAILLKLTKYVSLGSIIVFFISGLLTFIEFFRTSPLLQVKLDIFYPILILFIATFIVIKHRSNITRLQQGTENKIKWMG